MGMARGIQCDGKKQERIPNKKEGEQKQDAEKADREKPTKMEPAEVTH